MDSELRRRCKGRLPRALSVVALLLWLSPVHDQVSRAMQRAGGEGEQIDRLLRRYQRLRLDPQRIAGQVRETGTFLLATGDQALDVFLEPYDLRATTYRAEEEVPGGTRRILSPQTAYTYRGTVPGLADSEARFTIRDRSFEGVILTPGDWYYVEPLRNFSPSADPSEMVFYRKSDIRMETLGTCGATLAHRIGVARSLVEPQILAEMSGISIADVATEADYEYVTASGGATEANATILDVLNQVDGIYQTQLSIALRVVYQHAWSTPDDPYLSTSASAMLTEFRNYWNSQLNGIAFDLAHMWTGKNMDGSTIGIAYLSVVCSARTYSYGISQRFTSSPGKYILSAHEIGHNFGATHPDQANPPQTDCSNTIMNSSVGTGTTFCAFSRAEITSHVTADSSCLVSGPAAPSNLTAAAVSSSQINLSWQDNSSDEIGFALERKEGAVGTWAQIATTPSNQTSYNNTGLPAGATYYYRIRANSAAGSSPYSNEASATTLTSLATVTGMMPSSGNIGTLVTITGTNFLGASAVRFNTTDASAFTVVSATQITANVPAGATTGRISVVTPAGTATSSALFTVSVSRCDLNLDGSINVLDIQLMINTILGIPGSPGSVDLNGDGSTNVLDLQLLINVILGLRSCPG